MTRVAFFAPMKPPTHPVPSGDREMARNLMRAIAAGGAQVDLVSDFRVHDKSGDTAFQSAMRKQAETEAARLIEALRHSETTLWVTYHNYYKAPDLIGPVVCRALGLPYVQIESTRAKSRLTGDWSGFAEAAESSCDAADVVFYLTANDLITLERHRPEQQRLVHLRPFLPAATLPRPSACIGPVLSAGMMREGDKLASYRIIAETFALLEDVDWQLEIAGDGPARAKVEALMAPFGPRVRFLGQLGGDQLASAYARAALFFWPGVNEAFGMVYLEAQAAGLPVVAQDRPGVRDILLAGAYPDPKAGAAPLAGDIRHLLASPAKRLARSQKGRAMIEERHLIGTATETFWSGVAPLLENQK